MKLGKWRVFWGMNSHRWVAYQIGSAYTTHRPFDTHAEALAYAIEQAEAGR